jgi:hypothetical protein
MADEEVGKRGEVGGSQLGLLVNGSEMSYL